MEPLPGTNTPNPELLRQRRKLARGLIRATKEIKRLERELYTDKLTGLANDRFLEEVLPSLVSKAHSSSEPLALLVADVDGLHRANKHGRPVGDVLLKAVAEATKASARPTDIVARAGKGADEFVVVLPGFSPMEGQSEADLFDRTTERFRATYTKEINKLGLPDEIAAGVSFGIAILQPGESAERLFSRADAVCMTNKISMYEDLKARGVDPRR
jgi:diguanylate cyclase (GGDEF)-like protein